MNLATQLANQNRNHTPTERAQLCCDLAKKMEKAGEYEAAYQALAAIWPDRYGSPKVDDLDERTRAEVLLRVGALAGFLSSSLSAEGQERAKNFITQSIEFFEEINEPNRVAEAQSDLALCYWREGAFDEARINLTQAFGRVTSDA